MNKSSILLILAGVVTTGAAGAAPVDNMKAYDAVYEQSSPVGKLTMHQLCDGKGHLRTETEMSGQKTITILDFPNQVAITVMEAQKMYMKTPMTAEAKKSADPTGVTQNAKSLGVKVIDAHPCHGYESKAGDVVSLVWIGDDIHNVVRSESTSPHGKTTMALKRYSAAAPAQDLTIIPADCKEMKVPGR